MDILNRFIIVVAAIVVIAGAIMTVLVASEAADPDFLFSGWFDSQFQEAADSSGGEVAAIITTCIAIALATAVLLIYEIIPMRRPVKYLIGSSEQGISTIDRDSIRELVESTAMSFQNVRDVRCKVVKSTGGLIISCRSQLSLGTNLSEITSELQSKIKNTVEELTGLTVLQINVKSKYESGRTKHTALR